MAKKKLPTDNVVLENVEVLRTPFRNFSGSPTQFNPEGGKRYFNIRLEANLAEELRADGWRVRELKPRDDQDEPMFILEIKVGYNHRPPRVVKVTPAGKANLGEDVVGALDAADIEFADVIINPFDWGGETVSAYLQTGYFTIKLDELEMKYGIEDDMEEVICDDEGICYIDGVRIN